MNWNKIKTFYHAANAGSFTEAAKRMYISQSAISRSVIDLESRLGAKVFERLPRGIRLTRQGQVLYDLAHKMFMELEGAKKVFSGQEEAPAGELKIGITPVLGTSWLMPSLPGFVEKYPDLKLFIAEIGGQTDSSAHDLTINVANVQQSKLIQQPMCKLNFGLYASPKYLEKFGEPLGYEDLTNHRLITIGEDRLNIADGMDWILYVGLKDEEMRSPSMLVRSADELHKAAKAGMGVVALAEEDHRLEGSGLVRLLPDIPGLSVDVEYSYPEQLRHSKRVNALVNFLQAL